MQLTVKNFRGIERAAINLAPIALVAGPNAAGKSSVAMAMAAALMQTPMPIDGVAKNQASKLLRRESKRGSATVDNGHGAATVNWPGGAISTEGLYPVASEYAVGVVSVAGMKSRDAASALRSYMNCEPSRDDLRAALPAAEVPDAVIDNIWQAIESEGWDAAHRRAKESGIKAKGKWEHITGDNYGSEKALRWVSPLVPSDDSREIEVIEEALAAATGVLEGLIGQQALSDDERQRLEETSASPVPDVAAISSQLLAAEAELEQYRQYHSDLARPVAMKDPLSCPHCGAEVEICGGQVVKFTAEIDNEENLRRAAAIADALTAKNSAESRCLSFRQQLIQAEAIERHVSDAKARLDQFAGRSVGDVEIESARQQVRHEQDVLMGLQATIQAEKVAVGIQINRFIVEALDVGGVRQTVMVRALQAFNDRLAALSAVAGWGDVAVTDDMQVTYDGGVFSLLSASEQFRCRVTLQVAMAELDASRAMVIDAADILDKDGRNGLFKLIRNCAIPTLVAMTMNAKADVPNLAKAGMGLSYWIDDSVADLIS